MLRRDLVLESEVLAAVEVVLVRGVLAAEPGIDANSFVGDFAGEAGDYGHT